jgi:2-(1,2-epoxy-1,2-dihydrophenyl)acetyl-CoA isomerase
MVIRSSIDDEYEPNKRQSVLTVLVYAPPMTDSLSCGLRIERRDAALWLILDRPHRRNALTLELATTLADVLSDLPDGVRAVVLTGSPPVFCSGGDLADLDAVRSAGPVAISDVVYGRFHRLVGAIAAAPVPVIAAVNGPALGGGFDLALACDLRVATADASFASSWITVGLVPGMGGAHMLTRLLGAARAAEFVLLGGVVDARTALRLGLVGDVLPADGLDAHVARLAERIAALPPAAMRRSKAALRRARDAGLAEELATLGAVQASLGMGPEFREATARFRDC